MSTSSAAALHPLWQHVAEGSRLYTILDGARDERIYPNVLLAKTSYACLYRGTLPGDLAAAAPYLLELQPDLSFARWLFRYGWGHSWGIFLTSTARFNDVQRHFRRFLMVNDERGGTMYFRYYDPRVLRVYLPTCTQDELGTVFGPVEQFFVENEADGTTAYALGHDGLQRLEQTW